MNKATQEGKLDYIGANELVFNNSDKDGIHSGGFSVNSIMMKAGMSPIMTMNTQVGGDNVSDLFNSLVVPNWVLSYDNRMAGGAYKEHDDDDDSSDEDDVRDDLHDKLLDLVKEHESKLTQGKKKSTRKNGAKRNSAKTKKSVAK